MKSVLIAEDDPGIVTTLEIYFRDKGFRVVHAYTIAEALRIMGRLRIDLFLLDYFMDAGFTCAPLVKATKQGANIIIMTASSTSTDEIKRHTGIDCVIFKPFTLEEFEVRINAECHSLK